MLLLPNPVERRASPAQQGLGRAFVLLLCPGTHGCGGWDLLCAPGLRIPSPPLLCFFTGLSLIFLPSEALLLSLHMSLRFLGSHGQRQNFQKPRNQSSSHFTDPPSDIHESALGGVGTHGTVFFPEAQAVHLSEDMLHCMSCFFSNKMVPSKSMNGGVVF